MAMDAKEKKKLTIRILAAVIIVVILGVIGILLFGGEDEEQVVDNLGPSDSMIPGDPGSISASASAGQIIVNPAAIVFNPGQRNQIISVVASGAPITLIGFEVPPEVAGAVTVTSLDCPSPPQPLPAGSSCNINVVWDGATPVSSFLDVQGSIFAQEGEAVTPVSVTVAITAQQGLAGDLSGLPVQPGFEDGTAPTGEFSNGNESFESVPSQPQFDNTSAPAQPALSSREQQQNAYRQTRQQGGLAGIRGGSLNPAASRSAYSGWDAVGATGRTSSFPTDMSRVITPDKPITAVISFPIDSGNPVTAVAMVDRDIYGNNGRTVVIPRGSKLIGSPGVSGGGGRVRLGIAWKQLIRPDGTRFVFDAQSGDASGRGNIPGRVDQRYLERYGYSVIPAAISAGVAYAAGGNQVNNVGVGGGIGGGVGGGNITQVQDARAIAAQILSQPLLQASQDLAQRGQELQPQVIVPAGTRITIWSVDDLRLKPAGERPRDPNNAQRQGQQGQQGTNRGNAFPGSSRNGQQGNAAAAPNNARTNEPEGSEDISDYEVGTIDQNGNYVAPGSKAPSPSREPLNRNR